MTGPQRSKPRPGPAQRLSPLARRRRGFYAREELKSSPGYSAAAVPRELTPRVDAVLPHEIVRVLSRCEPLRIDDEDARARRGTRRVLDRFRGGFASSSVAIE